MAAPRTGPGAKKNPEDRLGHRTKAEQETGRADVIDAGAIDLPEIEVPEDLKPAYRWHPVAKRAYAAWLASPLRLYYEQTDVVQAWITCELISQTIRDKMSAGKVQQLRMFLADLGFSEASRREMDIAIKKAPPAKPDERKLASVSRLRSKAAGAS